MIKTVLNVDKICQDCPYFSSSTSHITNYDNYHIVEITCEHHGLCGYLQARFRDLFENKKEEGR